MSGKHSAQLRDAGWEHPVKTMQRCARVHGYSVHANVAVKPEDRAGLERICRYGLRSPIALERLRLTEDGKVRYRLKRPWPTPAGITHLTLAPLDFLKRLACLIPPPRAHLIRYHGVFANRSPHRTHLPAPPRPKAAPATDETQQRQQPTDAREQDAQLDSEPAPKSARLRWAQLIRRVFKIDVETCPHCGGRRVQIAFLTDPGLVKTILDHLDLPAKPPPIAPARAPPQRDLDFEPELDFEQL